MPFDLDTVRARFPALAVTDNGKPRIHFDNPAGTQVPAAVAERMSACLLESNANLGGGFATSDRADAIVADAHQAMADGGRHDGPGNLPDGRRWSAKQRLQRQVADLLVTVDHVETRLERSVDVEELETAAVFAIRVAFEIIEEDEVQLFAPESVDIPQYLRREIDDL